MADALLLLAVFLSAYTGFACFALSQLRHWRAVIGGPPPRRGVVLALRSLGSMLLGASLVLALLRDGPSFGSLLFATSLSLAAMAVAFTLAWGSKWFSSIVKWFLLARSKFWPPQQKGSKVR